MSSFFSGHELVVFEETIRESSRVLYMHKSGSQGLQDGLKQLSLRTGWAIYLWHPHAGLANLKYTEPPNPQTQEFGQAIEFAVKRKHFSVFVFPVMNEDDWLNAKLYLSKRDDLSCDVVKYVFILPKGADSRFFGECGEKLSLIFGLDGTFVLRNGEWVDASALS